MTISRVIDVIETLSNCYPAAKFSDTAYSSWALILDPFTDEEVIAILPSVMEDSPQHCPSAPAIAKAVRDARNPPLNAQAAWDQVMKAVRTCAPNQTQCLRVTIPDGRVLKAAETIGWERIRYSPFSEHGTLFAQFKGVLTDTITTAKLDKQREALSPFGDTFPIGPGDFDTGDLPPELDDDE
jgi:hypothetical protein